MKNGVAYENQTVYLIISIYLIQGIYFAIQVSVVILLKPVHWLMEKSMGWFLYNGNTGLK